MFPCVPESEMQLEGIFTLFLTLRKVVFAEVFAHLYSSFQIFDRHKVACNFDGISQIDDLQNNEFSLVNNWSVQKRT